MKIATFGCSYTNYIYPTYADILAQEHEVKNFGWSGSGNDKIWYLLHKKIDEIKDHFVIVQWSSCNRFDYLKGAKWLGGDGSIFFDKTHWPLVKDFFNESYELGKLHNYLRSTRALFPDSLQMSMNKIQSKYIDINDLFGTYKGTYKFKGDIDWHPNLLQHLKIAKSIAPVSYDTELKVKNLHNKLQDEGLHNDNTITIC